MDTNFDFTVIGGGSAGYAAARTAVSQGLKTVVIDGAETLGGLCILRGCMPSKTLIESANRNLVLRHAAEFGLKATTGEPDIAFIRQRKRTLINDFASYRQGQLNDGRFTLLRGRAAFLNEQSLKIQMNDGSEAIVVFKAACIATGSVVHVPPMPGLRETGFWTSDDVLDAESLPSSLIVLGGGAIALELAHYAAALGRKVTLIQRSDQLLKTMDRECGETVAEAFRQRGVNVYCGTSVKQVERAAGNKRVVFEYGDGLHTMEAEEILVATGRSPNVAGLALKSANVDVMNGKVMVNAQMQTSTSNIFAAGDVCSELDVVHIAIQQGEIAATNAASLIRGERVDRVMDYRLKLFGVFCHPQVAGVGATEEELRRAGVPYFCASYPFNDHGKSMVMGEMHGFVKLIAQKGTGEILGGSVVGPEATELIHEIVVAMQFRCTARQLAMVPHYHPTLSEIWTYPAEELADQIGV